MPIELWFLIILFAFVFAYFLLTKRPIYEAMFLGFILMLALTGSWKDAGRFFWGACTDSLVYAIIAFVALSKLLSVTGVIDGCISLILAIFGRLTGGAGYVAVIASTFMGALSGSGPGNVMATGVITIPAMKSSGFPPHLAAGVAASASTMGNMIPPSGIIVATFGCYAAFCPDSGVNVGKFWLILWAIAAYFIVQRIVTLYAFCKYYKVAPMKKEELPSIRETFRKSRKSLLLPVIILAPFLIDSQCGDFFTARLGAAGAKSFSSCLLLFIAGVAAMYTLLIAPDKSKIRPAALAKAFASSLRSMVPTVVTVIFSYAISNLFNATGISAALTGFIGGFGLSAVAIAFLIPLLTAFLGMIFPGSTQIAMFGTMLITVMAAAGIDPLLAAAMLPAVCGAMSGITPPVAVCTFAAMGIAESDYKKTVQNTLVWVALHYILSVLLLLGILPVLGI